MDVAVAALLVVALVVTAVVLWRDSPAAGTTDTVATRPITAAQPAGAVPESFVEAWRAPSAATVAPVVAGPAVVTADGDTVAGRDATTGAAAWSYTRNLPLCTAAAAFPGADGRRGRLLALYEGSTGYCSEMTALHPDTGARAAARNPDVQPGTRLVADDTFVVATGEHYLEVERSDLVRTLEYGEVIAPAQPGRQPRPGCAYSSIVLAARRLGVIERCPDAATDRLTVLSPDPEDSDKPEEEFSVPLPTAGATVVALSTDRVAVALPNPPRLELLDRKGVQVGQYPLDVPAADLTGDPPGRVPVTATARRAGSPVYWWTGSRTVALDAADLVPRWTIPDTLGPAQPYGDGLLVPVPAGLLDLDPRTGAVLRTLPLTRPDPAAPVRLATAGRMLLEQRGAELVALRPPGP